MTVNELKTILEDQREEFLSLRGEELIYRPEEEQLSLNSHLAQVVIGVRRSGKSTLCADFLLRNAEQCAVVNFDDDRLFNMHSDDLNRLLETIYIIYNNPKYLFFDEIQNIEAWPLFVNRLLRQHKHIFLSGSNAHLLSNELITHLTGRHNVVTLFPFSFRDFCTMRGVDISSHSTHAMAMRTRAMADYMEQGGFPELMHEKNKHRYIESLVEKVVRVDIARRFRIRHIETLRNMADYLMDNYAHEFAPKRVSEIFGISSHTAENYYSHLKEAFLLIGIPLFSFKSRERLRHEKVYLTDVAFANFRQSTPTTANLGWRLENIVCVELLRRCTPQFANIYYYKDRSHEIDFVVAKNGKVEELVQICYALTNDKTRTREINALTECSKKLHCDKLTIVTMYDSEEVEHKGLPVHIRPIAEWILEKNPANESV